MRAPCPPRPSRKARSATLPRVRYPVEGVPHLRRGPRPVATEATAPSASLTTRDGVAAPLIEDTTRRGPRDGFALLAEGLSGPTPTRVGLSLSSLHLFPARCYGLLVQFGASLSSSRQPTFNRTAMRRAPSGSLPSGSSGLITRDGIVT